MPQLPEHTENGVNVKSDQLAQHGVDPNMARVIHLIALGIGFNAPQPLDPIISPELLKRLQNAPESLSTDLADLFTIIVFALEGKLSKLLELYLEKIETSDSVSASSVPTPPAEEQL